MTSILLGVSVLFAVAAPGVADQRRGAAPVTFAIEVSDPDGTPVRSTLVTVEGPASRSVRTEGGRIALENLPAGVYRLRFQKQGFVTLERELTARGGKPIEVKVTLEPLPEPPPPPPAPATPAPPRPPVVKADPAVFDVPSVIEKEFVGRAPSKVTPLACGGSGSATLIQLNDPIVDHSHPEADEFVYVVAGEGSATVAGSAYRLHAGVLLFVPRAATHTLTQSGRNPLIILATRAGNGCGK